MRRGLMAVCAVVLAAGCEQPRTELVVRVESELAWGSGQRVQSVVLTVRRSSATGLLRSARTTALGTGGERLPLPLFVGVTAVDDVTTPVWIEALGCGDPNGCTAATAVVAQRAVVRFTSGQTEEVPLLLASRCAGVACASDQRCTMGGVCEAATRAQETVRPYTGAMDASVDARADAVVTAAGDAARDAVVALDAAVVVDAPDDADPIDAGDGRPSDVNVTDGGPRCVADRDGIITRAEINYVVGTSVLYSLNNDGTTVSPVDTMGGVVGGVRRWDYSAARTEDRRVLDEFISPEGRWWSSSYPDATYAAMLDRTNNILGVYRASTTALELLGTVSVAENATNLMMTPPVVELRFPLRVGDAWSQSVTAAGVYNFNPLTNVAAYTTRVDAVGEVWTPAGRYPALRVRTDLDQSIPLTIIRRTRRTYTFLSECWGVVARVASVDNESAEAFTRASEFRRLGL